MLKPLSIVTGAAFVFAVSLAAQPQYGQSSSQRPQKSASSSSMQSAPSAADFLKTVAQDNQAEIELAQLAQSKSANPQVKQYAQMLVSDHTKAQEKVTSLAKQNKIDLPSGVAAAQSADKDRLQDLSGASFDRAYIDAMVSNHRKAVSLFQKEASSSVASDVKSFAQTTVSTLQHHLQEAQRLQKTLGAGSSGGK